MPPKKGAAGGTTARRSKRIHQATVRDMQEVPPSTVIEPPSTDR